MQVKKLLLCSGVLALAFQAGTVQARGVSASINAFNVSMLTALALGTRIKSENVPQPRGMVVCADSWSQYVCRAGLRNGDFEDQNTSDVLEGWLLETGKYSPETYLGKTPDSRVLALPGKGAAAISGVILPPGSTLSATPQKTYTVKLRARGSGALPADVAVGLFVGHPDGSGDEPRLLASATRTVGWDWVDIDFKVDGVTFPEPAMLMVAVERTDNNTPTMLQVDDVRIVRTRLGATPPAE